MVTSFEFFEHIAPERLDALVAWLSKVADVLLTGAATPGQGGKNYVNEAWPRYWANLFARRGLHAYDFVRLALWSHAEIPACYVQNTTGYFKAGPPQAFVDATEAIVLVSLLHPEMFARAIDPLKMQLKTYIRRTVASAAHRFRRFRHSTP